VKSAMMLPPPAAGDAALTGDAEAARDETRLEKKQLAPDPPRLTPAWRYNVDSRNDCSTPRQSLIQTRRMWEDGPLRQWAEKRITSSWVRHRDGWAGKYVCDDCGKPTPGGLYSVRQMEGCKPQGTAHTTSPVLAGAFAGWDLAEKNPPLVPGVSLRSPQNMRC
jgi:hypothetical protein